jgi:hypothetical protein
MRTKGINKQTGLRPVAWTIALCGLIGPPGSPRAESESTQKPNDTARGQFVDIADASGLSAVHQLGGSPGKKYILETTSSGVALFDYDGDGWLDVYFVNGGSLEIVCGQKPPVNHRLFRNKRDGAFEDVTEKANVGGNGAWGMGVAVADYDNDGRDDLYVTNFGPNVFYHNNGDGTFTDVTAKAAGGDPRYATGAAFGDYDGDGDLDLFVANYVELDLNHLPEPGGKNIEGSNFCFYRGVPVMCGPRGLKGAGDTLYRNNGHGTFTDVSKKAGVDDPKGYYGFQPIWCDFDNDGDLDLYVANDSTPNYLYLNNGDGSFKEVGYPAGVAVNEEGREQASMGVAAGDYDGEGLMDVYVTNFSDDTNTLYPHDGQANFTDVTFQSGQGEVTLPPLGWGTAFFDFDNDGDVDLFAANGHVYPEVDKHDFGMTDKQRNLLFENDGRGKFAEIGRESGPGLAVVKCSRGAAVGDIDNDGDLDLVVNNLDDTPTVLRNDGGNRNHWIAFKLIGSKSNRRAINARVRVRAGERWQTGEVFSGSSYLSQNDFRVHSGLGRATKVDEVEIRWPSGTQTRLQDVKANQFLTVKEPMTESKGTK